MTSSKGRAAPILLSVLDPDSPRGISVILAHIFGVSIRGHELLSVLTSFAGCEH